MPDENKTTNTNQPITEEVPTVGQPNPTATPTPPSTTIPDTSGQVTDTPPPPPMQDGAFSPPPPIVEEKKPKETTTPTQETGTPKDTQAIPDIPPVISTSDTGGKKPVSKKMIATILGVLVLVGGIGAGVILVQNQQDIREKADVATCAGGVIETDCVCSNATTCVQCTKTNEHDYLTFVTVDRSNCEGLLCGVSQPPPLSCYDKCIANGNTPGECNALCATPSCYDKCIANGNTPGECNALCAPEPTPTASPSCYDKCIANGNTPGECNALCATPSPPNACDKSAPDVASVAPDGYKNFCDDRRVGVDSCYNTSGQAGICQLKGWTPESTQAECTCKVTSPSAQPSAQPSAKPTPKPTLLPGIDCSCLTIKAFDDEWNVITNLSSLVAGDVVRFTVSGKTNSGSIDKARFTINGTLRSGVTVKRPGTNEFYDEYTIPEGVTTFTINAELRHTALGWF